LILLSYETEKASFVTSKKDMAALHGIFGKDVDGRVSYA
jgi:hypothetical protein